jgi:outer membrane protein
MRIKNLIMGLSVPALLLTGNSLHAQAPKLGHINTQELLAAMPESDSAQAKLQRVAKEFQDQLEQMQVEFNKKYADFNANQNTWSDLIKTTKGSELEDMQQRIQTFQNTAEQSLQEQRTKIFKPVLDKANKGIADVAKENKFTYVFDVASGVVLYEGTDSQDILPLVKKKLGLND